MPGPFQPLDLATVYRNAETIRAMKSNTATDELQRQYLRNVQMPNAQAAETRAMNQETRAAQSHGSEQTIVQLRTLNAAAAEIAANPQAAQRWMPQLKAAGLPVEQLGPMDQNTAKQLFESTSKALEAYKQGNTGQLRVQSGFVGADGFQYNRMSDGTVVSTGVRAAPTNAVQFREIQLPDGRIVQGTQDPQTGAIFGMSGELLAPPMRGGAPGAASQPVATQPGLGQGRAPEAEKRATELAEADAVDLTNAPKRLQSANATITQINQNVLPILDSAIANANVWTTGLLSGVHPAGSPAADLAANLKTIEADTAFNELQAMRDASPTGGALGAISEREIDLLSARRRSLLQSQSPEQFRQNATALRDQYARTVQIANQAKQVDQLKTQELQLSRRQPTPDVQQRIQAIQERRYAIEDSWWDSLNEQGGEQAAPQGVDPELWKYMKPEERALWQ